MGIEFLRIFNKFEDHFKPPIKPWGLFPILMILLMFFLLSISIYLSIKYLKDKKKYNIVIFIFGLIFLGMELQHEIGRFIAFKRYDWSSFPFQFCSVSMYLCLIVPWIKNDKIRTPLVNFLGIYTLISGFLPLFLAQGNLTRWETLEGVFFSFFWHIFLMNEAVISIIHSGIAKNIKKDYKILINTFLVFVSITIIAQLLNVAIHYGTNANELYPIPLKGYKEVDYIKDYIFDPDSASLFYISPFFKSNITIVFDVVWEKAGWYTCHLLYVIAFGLASILTYFIIFGIRKLFDFIIKKIDDNNKITE